MYCLDLLIRHLRIIYNILKIFCANLVLVTSAIKGPKLFVDDAECQEFELIRFSHLPRKSHLKTKMVYFHNGCEDFELPAEYDKTKTVVVIPEGDCSIQ